MQQKYGLRAKKIPVFALFMIVLIFAAGCRQEAEQSVAEPEAPRIIPPRGDTVKTCQECHQILIDPAHDLDCTTCHGGTSPARESSRAHAGMVTRPASPDNMEKICVPCHQEQGANIRNSLHFTLRNEVNQVRGHFQASETLAGYRDIPEVNQPATITELADDLLRRRCLRCHPGSSGDGYAGTRRGLGCASCHLEYDDSGLVSHIFQKKPADRLCLTCHYGNRVGADYYGRFEHDFSFEFRSPYADNGDLPARPYGVEYHQLTPDVHQQAGLACIDCHRARFLKDSDDSANIACRTCHLYSKDNPLPSRTLSQRGKEIILTAFSSGREYIVPQLTDPAHALTDRVDCAVCHAQWSFNDQGQNLMRHDIADYDPWFLLTVQGSSEVENLLERNIFSPPEYQTPPTMTDAISGRVKPGIWYNGYVLRRWESPLIRPDAGGILRVMRPILDLTLSYVDSQGQIIFDAVSVNDSTKGLRPYAPHTIGRAGAFYRQRIPLNNSQGK